MFLHLNQLEERGRRDIVQGAAVGLVADGRGNFGDEFTDLDGFFDISYGTRIEGHKFRFRAVLTGDENHGDIGIEFFDFCHQ